MNQLLDRVDFAPIREWSDSDHSWLVSRFPFLSAACLKVAIELETELTCGRDTKAVERKHDQMWAQITALRNRLLVAARDQLKSLLSLSAEQTPESKTARRILWLMLLFPGSQPEELAELCQSEAARVLRSIDQWSAECVQEDMSYACTAITRRMNLANSTRIDLLQAFMHLAVRDTPIDSRLSGEKIGAILTEAILLEISRDESRQSFEYGSELLRQLKTYRYPAAAEVLQVIAESHWSEALRQLARETLKSLNDSLRAKWDATIYDDRSTTQQREKLLIDVVRERDVNKLIATMFSQMKGFPIADCADRRISTLHKLLAHPKDEIRIAACYALLKGTACTSKGTQAALNPAIAVLADLAVNSRSPKVMNDAFTLIEQLKQENCELTDKISQACNTANKKFVGHALLCVN